MFEEQFCYVTTKGRRSGRRHEIEIWFGLEGRTLYMLSGGRERSDWVRNILAEPEVSVRIGERVLGGRGRAVEAGTKMRLRNGCCSIKLPSYSGWRSGATALPVAVTSSHAKGTSRSGCGAGSSDIWLTDRRRRLARR
jgi:deazaflavin-dependent oxidoreductase (nitroreductase family)